MQFDMESCLTRMKAALQNPTNQLEGGFCMDNLRAVSQEIARFNSMELALVKAKIAQVQESVITAGNENHYVYLSKQVPGVGNARAKGLRDGSGTVLISIISDSVAAPSPELLAAVAAYLEARRIVGAGLIISAAEGIDVALEAEIVLRPGYTVDEATFNVHQSLQAWLTGIAFGQGTNANLSYAKVGDILFDVPGIGDVLSYTVNGGRDNLQGDFNQYFQLKEVLMHVTS